MYLLICAKKKKHGKDKQSNGIGYPQGINGKNGVKWFEKWKWKRYGEIDISLILYFGIV